MCIRDRPNLTPTVNESHDVLIKINGTAHSEDNDGFESWTTVEEATKPDVTEEIVLEETKITENVTDNSEEKQESQESIEIPESVVSTVNDTKESELSTHTVETVEQIEDLTDGDNTATQPKPALHECDTHTIKDVYKRQSLKSVTCSEHFSLISLKCSRHFSLH